MKYLIIYQVKVTLIVHWHHYQLRWTILTYIFSDNGSRLPIYVFNTALEMQAYFVNPILKFYLSRLK